MSALTPRTFYNVASEACRLAIVSKVIGVAEEIEVVEACEKWGAEIKAAFANQPVAKPVKVHFSIDLGDDFLTVAVSGEYGNTYTRSVDFSPEGDTAIADLVHVNGAAFYEVVI